MRAQHREITVHFTRQSAKPYHHFMMTEGVSSAMRPNDHGLCIMRMTWLLVLVPWRCRDPLTLALTSPWILAIDLGLNRHQRSLT